MEYLKGPSSATNAAVYRAMPEAEMAMLEGGGGYTFTDPPAMGSMRQQYSGLSQTAFLHETGWGPVHGRETYEMVLEGIESVDGVSALGSGEWRCFVAVRPTGWTGPCGPRSCPPLTA